MNSAEMRQVLEQQAETLERLATEPLDPATVVKIKGSDVLVHSSNGPIVIAKPTDKLAEGDSILINRQSSQYVRTNPFEAAGSVVTVNDVVDGNALLEIDGRTRLIPAIKGLEPGDKVVLDHHSSFIVRIFPRTNKDYVVPETSVTWDDIGGLQEAKEAMIEAVEHPHLYKEIYEHYGSKGTKGILLYGPPGCGKTMLGKAAATSIGSADGFIYCKGPEVLDPYVGVAEATVRSLFARARSYEKRSNRRAVIFIDEAEALLGRRGSRHSFMEKTIVPTFLAEMDGVEDSGAVVILATNQAMSLDPAVVRDGRVDRKIKIARPNALESRQIVLAHLKKTPCGSCFEELTDQLLKQAWDATFHHEGKEVALNEYVSGALWAGIVEKAKRSAMRRDIDSKTKSGIGMEDLQSGLLTTLKEMGATSLEALT